MATSGTVSNHFLEDLENLQDDSLSPEKWAKNLTEDGQAGIGAKRHRGSGGTGHQ